MKSRLYLKCILQSGLGAVVNVSWFIYLFIYFWDSAYLHFDWYTLWLSKNFRILEWGFKCLKKGERNPLQVIHVIQKGRKRCTKRDANVLLSLFPLLFFFYYLVWKQIVCEGYLKISKPIKIIYGIEAEIARKANRPEMKYGWGRHTSISWKRELKTKSQETQIQRVKVQILYDSHYCIQLTVI